MNIFENVSILETKLKDYLDQEFYAGNRLESYLNVDQIIVEYCDVTRNADIVWIRIVYGRTVEARPELNEEYPIELGVPINYKDNLDFITGLFAAELNKT